MTTALHYQAFKSFLGPATVEGFRSSSSFRKDARGKLQKLPFEQFSELTKDVYDELIRRTKDIEFTETNHENLPSKRNQARQKLGTLSDKRFYDLVGDLFVEILIRYPGIDPMLKDESSTPSEKSIFNSPPYSNSSNTSFSTYFDPNLTATKEPPNLTSRAMNSDKASTLVNKYDTELNHALQRNRSLEKALKSKYSDSDMSLSKKNNLNGVMSNMSTYELLKQDFHILRKEFEKLNMDYKKLSHTNEKLTVENEELKQKLSLYEIEGSQNISLNNTASQAANAQIKEEYEKEIKKLAEKHHHLEMAQSVHREMFDAITKNNEILEFKLRQVNQALEKTQKESFNSLKKGSSDQVEDYGNSYLIHENLMRTLRSSTDKVLKSLGSKNSNDVLLSLKPLVETSRSVIDVVEQFESEVQDNKQNFTIQISNNKEDFSSALSNLMTLAKKEAASSNIQNQVRFEHEAKELLSAAEELQLLLQTNFCALPYFSTKANRFSTISKMEGSQRISINTNQNMQKSSIYDTNLSHISKIPQVNNEYDTSSSSLEDAILDPLRDYIEEQSDGLILSVDEIMEFVRNDDFSTHLSDQVKIAHEKAAKIILEFKQYRLIPRLMDSSIISNSLKGVENANERFSELLKDLDPIVSAKNLTIEEIEELDPTIKLLKTHLASTCLDLAKSIKVLAQSLI